MNKKNKEGRNHGYEAYKTLEEWVKSVPSSIKKLEDKGDKDELMRYKKQVKMVLDKLEDIKNEIENK
tara:strand:- start:2372 stop:2572 length:201 start_codon:yes stop_codon:yes gene_type:complete